MPRFLALTALLLSLCLATPALAEDTTLFDREGTPVAYIVWKDDTLIRLWEGEPVAKMKGQQIYGINGRHIGWIIEGIVRDLDGKMVGSLKDALPFTYYRNDCCKPSPRYYYPKRVYQSPGRSKPYHLSDKWSALRLTELLRRGLD